MIPKWFFDDSRPGILQFHYDSIATNHCYVMHRNKRSIVVILKFYSQEKWNPQITWQCDSLSEIVLRPKFWTAYALRGRKYLWLITDAEQVTQKGEN